MLPPSPARCRHGDGCTSVIAIAVLTHNRLPVLRQCVENVVARTSELTSEIVIWNNSSEDGTREYLASLSDPRLKIVNHAENIAMNAIGRAFRLTTAPYLIELDDDVVDAPERWDETLLAAYRRLPRIGLLCASIAYDPDDPASRYLKYMREEVGAYVAREINGVRILEGSVGGACTMTSRALYDRVGGFKEHRRYPYWRPEIPFQRAMRKLGYYSAFLADLEVRHQGGSETKPPRPKAVYHEYEYRSRARKNVVKRMILSVPFAAALNRRYRWFDPPMPKYDPLAYGAEARAEQPSSVRQPS
jgi:GT2 family glycosyltransferase